MLAVSSPAQLRLSCRAGRPQRRAQAPLQRPVGLPQTWPVGSHQTHRDRFKTGDTADGALARGPHRGPVEGSSSEEEEEERDDELLRARAESYGIKPRQLADLQRIKQEYYTSDEEEELKALEGHGSGAAAAAAGVCSAAAGAPARRRADGALPSASPSAGGGAGHDPLAAAYLAPAQVPPGTGSLLPADLDLGSGQGPRGRAAGGCMDDGAGDGLAGGMQHAVPGAVQNAQDAASGLAQRTQGAVQGAVQAGGAAAKGAAVQAAKGLVKSDTVQSSMQDVAGALLQDDAVRRVLQSAVDDANSGFAGAQPQQARTGKYKIPAVLPNSPPGLNPSREAQMAAAHARAARSGSSGSSRDSRSGGSGRVGKPGPLTQLRGKLQLPSWRWRWPGKGEGGQPANGSKAGSAAGGDGGQEGGQEGSHKWGPFGKVVDSVQVRRAEVMCMWRASPPFPAAGSIALCTCHRMR